MVALITGKTLPLLNIHRINDFSIFSSCIQWWYVVLKCIFSNIWFCFVKCYFSVLQDKREHVLCKPQIFMYSFGTLLRASNWGKKATLKYYRKNTLPSIVSLIYCSFCLHFTVKYLILLLFQNNLTDTNLVIFMTFTCLFYQKYIFISFTGICKSTSVTA